MKLSDKACKSAKAKEKQYKLSDGAGLYLLVRTNGSKLWQMKYRFLGKEKTLSIGAYPIVTLSEARDARLEAKRLLAKEPPIDPMAQKAENKRQAVRNVENTFKAVALEWHALKAGEWSKGYADKNMRILTMNLFPYLDSRPIAEITPP